MKSANRAALRAELDYYGALQPTAVLMWEVDARRNDREYGYRLRWRQFYDPGQSTPDQPSWGTTRVAWRDAEICGLQGEPIAYPFHWPGHLHETFPPERIAALEADGWTVKTAVYEAAPPPRPVTFAAARPNTAPTDLGASCTNCHIAIGRPDPKFPWRHEATGSTYCPEIHPGHWNKDPMRHRPERTTTMQHYTVHALIRPATPGLQIQDEFVPTATVQTASGGLQAVTLTITATTAARAAADALVALEGHGDIEAISTGTAGALADLAKWENVPPLASVTEAAEAFGASRQAVLQRIGLGTLSARKIGREFAILATDLPTAAPRDVDEPRRTAEHSQS
ncbi:hypothetical protein ACFV9C_42315 [Kribbella sp. NPDC059898]|uniref:hypothetical protein n=1 Tax=Kribbella sp. NPDC059898 TaxID=3346995 RepID=UPI003662181D